MRQGFDREAILPIQSNKMAGSRTVGIACRDLKTQSLNTHRVEDGEAIMGLPTRGDAGF